MRRAHHLVAFRRAVLKHHFAGVIHQLGDCYGSHALALVRQHRIGAGHLQQAHFTPTQRQRESVILAGQAGDTQTLRHSNEAVLTVSVRVVVNAHVLQRFYRGNIVGISQRGPHRHGPMKAAVVIYRFVRRAGVIRPPRGRVRTRNVPNQRGRRPIFFECSQVRNRLDGRARLACLGQRHVHLATDRFVVEISRTDHRQDFAGIRVHRNHRAICGVVSGHCCQLFLHCALGKLLQVRVQRGIDAETGVVNCLGIVLAFQQRLDVNNPMGKAHAVGILREGIGFQRIRRVQSVVGAYAHFFQVLADKDAVFLIAQFVHENQHRFVARQGRLAVVVDIINCRGLRQTRQERRLPEGQFRCGDIEVSFRRGFDTVGEVAVENFVQIKLQHLFLAVAARNFSRQDDFPRFAVVRLFEAFFLQQQHARQLLGDGGRAGNNFA